jgi:16S rRNA (cytidine1402-2'-O)-methyltransferase
MFGKLYLVATPIGNLADITLRAIETLKEVDLIACEDKRVSGRLLAHYGISKKLLSYNDPNKYKSAPGIMKSLEEGLNVALITDAGSPGISDPGFYLVNLAIAEGVEVIPIPGPSALISALTVSGLPLHNFIFEGFLPPKGSKRKKRLESLREEKRTIVLYESPYKLVTTLSNLRETLGNRRAVIARELTKLHEEIIRSDLDGLIAEYAEKKPRGEFVIMVEGKNQ